MQVIHFQAANPVFCADRAAFGMHQIMHGFFDQIPLVFVIRAAAPFLRKDIVVQVAIADMTKTVDPKLSDRSDGGVGFGNKVRDRAKRDRDIVARHRSDPSIGLWNMFAD